MYPGNDQHVAQITLKMSKNERQNLLFLYR